MDRATSRRPARCRFCEVDTGSRKKTLKTRNLEPPPFPILSNGKALDGETRQSREHLHTGERDVGCHCRISGSRSHGLQRHRSGARLGTDQTQVTSLGAGLPRTEISHRQQLSSYYTTACTASGWAIAALGRSPRTRQDIAPTSVTIGGSGFDWHDVDKLFSGPTRSANTLSMTKTDVVCNKLEKLFDGGIMRIAASARSIRA